MPRQKNIIKICCAASHFASKSRNLTQIANTFKVSERTVRRWSENAPEWEEALTFWQYDGERSFETKPKRDAQRDARGLFEKARDTYRNAFLSGTPIHKLARSVVDAVGNDRLSVRRVREWAKTYRWLDTPKQTNIVVQTCCAALYFALLSRNITQIAEFVKVPEGTIRHWADERPEWEETLEICEYTGERSFKEESENREKQISERETQDITQIDPNPKNFRDLEYNIEVEAFNEGYQAALWGYKVKDNPYEEIFPRDFIDGTIGDFSDKEQTDQKSAWKDGFYQARKDENIDNKSTSRKSRSKII